MIRDASALTCHVHFPVFAFFEVRFIGKKDRSAVEWSGVKKGRMCEKKDDSLVCRCCRKKSAAQFDSALLRK